MFGQQKVFKWLLVLAIFCFCICGQCMAEEETVNYEEAMQLVVMPRDPSAPDSVNAITKVTFTCDHEFLKVGEEATWTIHLEGAPAEVYTFNYYLNYHLSSGSKLYSYEFDTPSLTYTGLPMDEGGFELYIKVKDRYGGEKNFYQDRIYLTEEGVLMQKVSEVVSLCKNSGVNTDYAIALFMHDYLIHHADYDETEANFGPGGVLLEGSGVCSSYARAYKLLMEHAGVECLYVVGSTSGGSHAWNMVKIDGVWYQVDCTWDDPAGGGKERHSYFLIPDAVMAKDHDWVQANYPACIDNRYVDAGNGRDQTYAGFVYNGGFGDITIKSYTGTEKNIVVPATINGRKVKKVLRGCFRDNNIRSLTFSEGIEQISLGFAIDCANLRSISLPSTARFTERDDTITYNGIVENCPIVESISVAESNPYLCVHDNILYDKEMTTLLYFPPRHEMSVIKIPEGVQIIYDDAFQYAYSVKELTLPISLRSIGSYALSSCSSLETVHIPAATTHIAQYALPLSLREITVDKNNSTYYDVDGVLYTRSGLLQIYPALKPDTVYTITEPIHGISVDAFRNAKNLVEIHLPDGLTSIGAYAFQYCSSLRSVELPESVTHLDDWAFSNCSSLIKLYIPAATKILSDRGTLLHGVQNVVIWGMPGSDAEAWAKKHNYPFQDVTQSTISGSCGLYNTWTLTEDGTLTLRLGSYMGTTISSMGTCNPAPWSLYADKIKSIVIEDGFSGISDDAFTGCVNLTSVSIPDSVTTIGARAFEGCEKLERILLPDGVTHIGHSAFRQCKALKDVNIPKNCVSILEYAFRETQFKEVHLPAALQTVGYCAFPADLEKITVDKANPVLFATDNVLYLRARERVELLVYAGGKPDTEFVVPDTVTNIHPYAFAYANHLVKISLPNSTYIDKYAFGWCTSLTSVTLSENHSVSLQDNVFKGCSALRVVRNSESIDNVHGYAFDGCSLLTGIRFSERLKDIYHHAFTNSSISTIVMASTKMPSVASTAFDGIFPTIHCYAGTEVEAWAKDMGFQVVPIELPDVDLPNDCTLQTGTTILLSDTLPDDSRGITWDISSSSVVSVEGKLLTANKPGTAIVKVSCAGIVLDEMTVTVVDEADGHEWDEGVVTIQPDCSTTGWRVHSCASCQLKKVTLLKGDHLMNDGVVCEPTCYRDGNKVFTCLLCGYSYSETIPASGHTWEIIPGTPATCTEPGWTNGSVCSFCGQVQYPQMKLPATGHQEKLIPGSPATCTTPGVTDGKFCSRCGEIFTAQTEIPPLGHTEETLPSTPATCTANGLTEGKKCSVCGEVTLAQTEIPALGHNEEILPGIPATVTTPGLTEGKKCSVCGEVIIAQTEIPPLGHSYDSGVVTLAPTCTADGVKTYTCTDCGSSYSEAIPALGHAEVTIPAVDMTCTTSGWTEGKECLVCHEVLLAPTEQPAPGHAEKIIPAIPPTCSESGFSEGVVCSRCGIVFQEVTLVPPLEHDYQNVVVEQEPTCTSYGYMVYTCSRCGGRYSESIPPVEHSFDDGVETEAPTCTTYGSKKVTCTECNAWRTVAVPPRGHIEEVFPGVPVTCTTHGWSDGKRCSRCGWETVARIFLEAPGHQQKTVLRIPATCTTIGIQDTVCERCGMVIVSGIGIPSLGHNFDEGVVTRAPTCTQDGVRTFTCMRCGGLMPMAEPVLGHKETIIPAVPATCTTSGLTEGKQCETCGEVFIQQQSITALGHNCSETITTAPSCTADGVKTAVCIRCGYSYTEAVPAWGHQVLVDAAIAPTCTSSGLTEGSRCGRCAVVLVQQESVPALGHRYNSGVETTAPTCTSEGIKTYTCATCGHSYTEAIPAKGHVEAVIPAVAPTCTETGLTEGSICSVCGETLVKQEIVAAKGHAEGDGIVTQEPTASNPGVLSIPCTNCGTILRVESIPATGQPRLPGDADGDGEITIFDALAIFQYVAEKRGEINFANADVDGNGIVNIHDALRILQYVSGWNVALL